MTAGTPERGRGWDLFAVPVGNMAAKKGTRLDTQEMRAGGFVHPIFHEGTPGLPHAEKLALPHLPAYVLRAPEGIDAPELQSDVQTAIEDLAIGLSISRAAGLRGVEAPIIRRNRVDAMDALGMADGNGSVPILVNWREREIITRALVTGVLSYDVEPGPVLTGRRVQALAGVAMGRVIQMAGRTREHMLRTIGATNNYNAIPRAFAVGALVVGPPYEPEEHFLLSSLPDVLSTAMHIS